MPAHAVTLSAVTFEAAVSSKLRGHEPKRNQHGCVLLPLPETPVVDTTGAGDAFVAGLITALAKNAGPQRAARLAAAAAGATVGHPGGRPALTPKAVQDQLTMLAESTHR